MIERTLDIATGDGAMETFPCRPEHGGPHAAISFLMGAPGLRDEPRDMARRRFEASGAAGELELYPGVHHGFAFPGRWCYDKAAAERHWQRLIALYRRCLETA